jgi:long-subunit acyl-CoA synthetase (AMP-forming)
MNFDALADRYRGNTASTIVEYDVANRRRELTYADLAALVDARADELRRCGIGTGHVIGIQARNRIEWVVWDLAAIAVGAILQAYPDDPAVPDIADTVARAGLALFVTDREEGTDLPYVVGVADPIRDQRPPDTAVVLDIAGLHSRVYSSGTTGQLKGLDISRAGTAYVIGRFLDCFPVTGADKHLIFLPLANYQQRLSVYACLWTGAGLVLAPYQRVFAAVKAESPTFLIAPPVFYDATLMLYGKTAAGQTLAEFLGGHLRFAITGMAPIRRSTQDAFWAGGVRLLEAYGMTECGMIAWNTEDAYRLGRVGRLIDPESVIFTDDGELLIRRAAPLSLGYFEADADTASDTFRADGTIATGDYGVLDDDGFLTLRGRKKDLIALGSGRKVHPAELEARFAGIDGVTELVIVPTPQSARLGAIVTAAADADRAAIRAAVERVNETLEPYQRVASVVFSPAPLHGDPRFMTANLKLSRAAAAACFAELATAAAEPVAAEVSA